MYLYLYDDALKNKKYSSTLKAIETRLTDLGIAGKIVRLAHFSNAQAVIEEEFKRGYTTVVIVGNDTTFGNILSRAATCRVVFGFLPIGPNNTIAEVLGIPLGVDACDVLSRRRKVLLDAGWVNNRYFVSRLEVFPHDIMVQYDGLFSVSSKNQKMELVVCNLQPYFWKDNKNQNKVIRPQDGKLEAFLHPVKKRKLFGGYEYEDPSIFPFEEMEVSSKTPFVVEADGKRSKEVKITIKLAKGQIEMIVGKQRKF